ncbi:hypothetical protein KL86SPO_31093 [uncultured Sporomusa sp.]|uniref:Uncharacterized protein n=1 Tax=uncultured Sporomusa sp. TaxID=307249 RepID=A0A212LTI0_9FIRM|nr:hypothetical protein [uncultured Sporomusa sp.]SCM80915.1 hypothetical protein KL86SPO_31093 [uncultured Sporomusa sp.]
MSREFIDQDTLNEVLARLNKKEQETEQARRKTMKKIAICVGITAAVVLTGGALFALVKRNKENKPDDSESEPISLTSAGKDVENMTDSELVQTVKTDQHGMDVDYIRALSDRVNEIVAEQGETEEVIDLVDEMNSLLDKGVLLEDVIEPGSVY